MLQLHPPQLRLLVRRLARRRTRDSLIVLPPRAPPRLPRVSAVPLAKVAMLGRPADVRRLSRAPEGVCVSGSQAAAAVCCWEAVAERSRLARFAARAAVVAVGDSHRHWVVLAAGRYRGNALTCKPRACCVARRLVDGLRVQLQLQRHALAAAAADPRPAAPHQRLLPASAPAAHLRLSERDPRHPALSAGQPRRDAAPRAVCRVGHASQVHQVPPRLNRLVDPARGGHDLGAHRAAEHLPHAGAHPRHPLPHRGRLVPEGLHAVCHCCARGQRSAAAV